MIGHECFKLYIPLKLHFTTEKYNVFENPRVKHTSVDTYNKRRDRKIFENLSTKFSEPRECVRFYVSNFAYGNKNFLYTPNLGIDNYNLWMKRKQSLTNIFKIDTDFLINLQDSGKIDINNIDNEIFKLFINSEITLETLVIFNSYYDLFDRLKNSESKLIWGDEILRLIKSERFVKFDKKKTDQIYYDYKNEISK